MLDMQITILSVDTGNFYSNREARIHRLLHKLKTEKGELKEQCDKLYSAVRENNDITKKKISLVKSGKVDIDSFNPEIKEAIQKICFIENLLKIKNKKIDFNKKKLLSIIDSKVESKNIRSLRNIHPAGDKDSIFAHEKEMFSDSRKINIFESNATRTIGAKADEFCDDLIVVQIYYFGIAKDIILNGFLYNGEKYIYYTSSAGQIRLKKAVFIKESTWNKIQKSIMCGLTVDAINKKGGCNTNKYLAYLALPNSATDDWEEFDIEKVIVVKDFENAVHDTVDFINESSYTVERKDMDVPITQTDGCGMILPFAFGKRQKNKMIRMPWVKGLLGVFDFVEFIKENKCTGIIEDIYGKQHDIITEGIEVILTESQFKMYKYYSSWEEYKSWFHLYNCKVGFTNEEEEHIKDATINYQMLQSLTDFTEEELRKVVSKSNESLQSLNTLFGIKNAFGVTPYNKNKTTLQEAIHLYPNLINDCYIKEKIRDIKNSLLKKYRSGALAVDGKYTFILPDLYAVCEYWFLKKKNPSGILKRNEVYCNLFPNSEKLDCLRSPHLYKEHCVKKNMAAFSKNKWFSTNALYISCDDMISKVIQCDFDGDKSLVISDETIIEIAERNMRNVVPLYYHMKKAEPVIINNYSLYNGLNKAFVSGNIGIYSNTISKIWNNSLFISGSDKEKREAERIVKLLCCENNFSIDEAKTLYMPERPEWFAKELSVFSMQKLPYFFKWAKDKTSKQITNKTVSIVNSLEDLIVNQRISFNGIGLKKVDIDVLKSGVVKEVSLDIINNITSCFDNLNKKYHFKINSACTEIKKECLSNTQYKQDLFFKNVVNETKDSLSQFGLSDIEVTEILVDYLYRKESKSKDLLWMCYGDIILNNIKYNIDNNTKIIECSICKKILYVPMKNNRTCMCEKCYKKYRKNLKKRNK